VCANAARRTVLNVDRSSHRDLVTLAVGLKREKRGSLHQADHVRRGINRRQLRTMRGKSVFELDRFLCVTARADGDWLRHFDIVYERAQEAASH
jgi:hypothetical protein